MANLLGYNRCDLELMMVKGNTQLRGLLINTVSKSIAKVEKPIRRNQWMGSIAK